MSERPRQDLNSGRWNLWRWVFKEGKLHCQGKMCLCNLWTLAPLFLVSSFCLFSTPLPRFYHLESTSCQAILDTIFPFAFIYYNIRITTLASAIYYYLSVTYASSSIVLLKELTIKFLIYWHGSLRQAEWRTYFIPLHITIHLLFLIPSNTKLHGVFRLGLGYIWVYWAHELMRYHPPIYVLRVSSHFWPFTKVNFVLTILQKSWDSVRPPPLVGTKSQVCQKK